MAIKSFNQWIIDNGFDKYPANFTDSNRDFSLHFAKSAWEYQRKLSDNLIFEVDLLSRAIGSLPAPLFVALLQAKGLEVPGNLLREVSESRMSRVETAEVMANARESDAGALGAPADASAAAPVASTDADSTAAPAAADTSETGTAVSADDSAAGLVP